MAQYLRIKRSWNGYASIGDSNPSGCAGIDRLIGNRGGTTAIGVASCATTAVGGIVSMNTAVCQYMVGGLLYTLAASTTVWDCRGMTSVVGPQVINVMFCADSAGATTAFMGSSTGSTANALWPNIPILATPVAFIQLDLQHLTTTEGYTWDQELGSHGTYFEGFPIAAMYE